MKRDPKRPLSVFFTVYLCLSLVLPPQAAYALRPISVTEGARPQLQQALAGAEEQMGAIDLAQLRALLRESHQAVLSGRLPPNSADLRLLEKTDSKEIYRLRVNSSGSPRHGFRYARLEDITVVIPDPASLPQDGLSQSRCYQAVFDADQIRGRLGVSGKLQETVRLAEGKTEQVAELGGVQGKAWLRSAFQSALAVVQETAPGIFPAGEPLTEQLLAHRIALIHGEEEPRVLRLLQEVRRVDSQIHAFRWALTRSTLDLAEIGDEKLPVSKVRESLGGVAAAAAPFARTHKELQGYLELFQEPIEADKLVGLYLNCLRRTGVMALDCLSGLPDADSLSVIYHDLYRAVFLLGLQRLHETTDPAQKVPLESAYYASQWLRSLRMVEFESAVFTQVKKSATPLSYQETPHKEGQKVADPFPVSFMGLLIQDKEGRWRYVPGAGGVGNPRAFSPLYNSASFAQWVQPDDLLVVLVHPCITGYPGFETALAFYQELVRLQQIRPATEILLGAADPAGQLRLFRANAPDSPREWVIFHSPWEGKSPSYKTFKDSVSWAWPEGGLPTAATAKDQSRGFTRDIRPSLIPLAADPAVSLVTSHLGSIRDNRDPLVLLAYTYQALWVIGEWFFRQMNDTAATALFTEVPVPSGSVPRRQTGAAGSGVPLSELGIGVLLGEILKADEWAGRPPQRWAELHGEFFRRATEAEKRLGEPTQDPEQLAWNDVIPTCREAARVSSMGALGNRFVYGRKTGAENQLANVAAFYARIYQARLIALSQGLPAEPPELEATLPAQEYFKRFRASLLKDITAGARSFPVVESASLTVTDQQDRPVRVPFVLALLTLEWMGLVPSRRPVSLAKAIVENGVRSIELLPAASGNPPVLLVRLGKAVSDPESGTPVSEVAVCVLKEPLRDRSQRFPQLDENISAEAMAQAATAWIDERRRNAVEFDPAAVAALAFSESDPWDLKLPRLSALMDRLLSGRALLGSNYSLGQEIRRQAVVLGRTPDERFAIALHIFTCRLVGNLPVVNEQALEAEAQPVREAYEEVAARILFFEFFKLGDAAFSLQTRERLARLEQRLGTPRQPFNTADWLNFRPLLRLLLLTETSEGAPLQEVDFVAVTNQLQRSRDLFLNPDVSVRIGQEATRLSSDAAALGAELSHAAFHALTKGQLKGRDASFEAALLALAGCNRAIFGEGAEKAPTTRNLQAAAYRPALGQARAAQQRGLAALEARNVDEIGVAVHELERAAGLLGPGVEVTGDPLEVTPLHLRDLDEFKKSLVKVEGTVARVLAVSSAPADPARLETFRLLAEALRRSAAGEPEESLRLLGRAEPSLLEGRERELAGRFRRELERRLLQEERDRAEASRAEWSARLEAERLERELRLIRETPLEPVRVLETLTRIGQVTPVMRPASGDVLRAAGRDLAARFAEQFPAAVEPLLNETLRLDGAPAQREHLDRLAARAEWVLSRAEEYPELRPVSAVLDKVRSAREVTEAILRLRELPLERRPPGEVLTEAAAAMNKLDLREDLATQWTVRYRAARKKLAGRLAQYLAGEADDLFETAQHKEPAVVLADVQRVQDWTTRGLEILAPNGNRLEDLSRYQGPLLRVQLLSGVVSVQARQRNGESPGQLLQPLKEVLDQTAPLVERLGTDLLQPLQAAQQRIVDELIVEGMIPEANALAEAGELFDAERSAALLGEMAHAIEVLEGISPEGSVQELIDELAEARRALNERYEAFLSQQAAPVAEAEELPSPAPAPPNGGRPVIQAPPMSIEEAMRFIEAAEREPLQDVARAVLAAGTGLQLRFNRPSREWLQAVADDNRGLYSDRSRRGEVRNFVRTQGRRADASEQPVYRAIDTLLERTDPSRAGAEELSEEDQLELEGELAGRVKGDFLRGLRVRGSAQTDAVRDAVGPGDRTREVLPAVGAYDKGDVVKVSAGDLKKVGKAHVWIGPGDTFFISERVLANAPPGLIAQALREGNPELLEQWVDPAAPDPAATLTTSAASSPAPAETVLPPTAGATASPPPASPPKADPPPAAPPPAPAPGEVLQTMTRLVGDAMVRPVLMENMVAHNLVTREVGVDTTGSEQASFCLLSPQGRFLRWSVLVPDHRVDRVPRRYVASYDVKKGRDRVAEKARDAAQKGDKSLKELLALERGLDLFAGHVARSKDRGTDALKVVTAALNRKDRDGKTARDRLAAYESGKRGQEEEVRAAVRNVGRMMGVEIDKRGVVVKLADDALRFSGREGKVPYQVAKAALGRLIEDLDGWPYLQQGLRAYVEAIPAGQDFDLEETGFLTDDLETQLHHDLVATLFQGTTPEHVHAVYYDAVRVGLSGQAEAAAAELARANSSDERKVAGNRIRAVLILALMAEQGEELADQLRASAKSHPARSKITTSPGVVGLLLLDAGLNPVRFIEGGFSLSESRRVAGIFLQHHIPSWAAGSAYVALVYPSFHGWLNPLQVDAFVQESVGVQRRLGPGPTLLAAAVTEKGELALYRPRFSTTDPVAWGNAAQTAGGPRRAGYERFKNAAFVKSDLPEAAQLTGSINEVASRRMKVSYIVQLIHQWPGFLEEILGRFFPGLDPHPLFQGLKTRFAGDLGQLDDRTWGREYSRGYVEKAVQAHGRVYDLVTLAILWAGEKLAPPVLEDLFTPVPVSWAPAPAPQTKEESEVPSTGFNDEVLARLVRLSFEQHLIEPLEEAVLRRFIIEVWAPGRTAGSYPFPRLQEAWPGWKKAEAERVRRENRAVAEAEIGRLGETPPDNFDVALETLARSGELAARLTGEEYADEKTRLQAAREKFAGSVAEAFVAQVELDLALDASEDLTPARIDPLIGRIDGELLPAVAGLGNLPEGVGLERGRLLAAVKEARVRQRQQMEQRLATLEDPLEIAVTLLSGERFGAVRAAADTEITQFLGRVQRAGGTTVVPGADRVRRLAQYQAGRVGGEAQRFYEAVVRLVDLLKQAPPPADQAGLEETTVELTDLAAALRREAARAVGNTVLFLRADLFDDAGLAELDDLTLAGLAIDLRQRLGWSEEGARDLQLVVVDEQSLQRHRQVYAGWRIIDVGRRAGSDPRALPVSAVPWVAAEALASGRAVFDVIVTPYLHLQEWTLPQALDELSHRIAA